MIFEHPLNERIRILLRLEHLFKQVDRFLSEPDPWATRAAIAALLEIIDITTLADAKNELLKELERHLDTLNHLAHQRGVDLDALAGVLGDLDAAIAGLQQVNGGLGQCAREDDLLKTIAQRSSIPGGTCGFDLPHFQHWLLQPVEIRQARCADWLSDLTPAVAGIQLALALIRTSARPRAMLAREGVFQDALEAPSRLQLLRVGLDPAAGLYPAISGHHNRFSIRFMTAGLDGRSSACQDDISFNLTCCAF